MTVIEFFDRESAVENIVSALLCAPEKVVFIGDSAKRMYRSIDRYREITRARGLEIEFEAKGAGKNDLTGIVNAINEVIDRNSDCIVDLSGGDDLFLAAVGIVYAERSESIRLHRFDISNNTMTDCDSDGVLCASGPITMSVEETVSVYGGKIDRSGNGTFEWDFSKEFVDDVYAIWSVCKENPTVWNVFVNSVCKLCSCCADGLEISIGTEEAKDIVGLKGNAYGNLISILKKLASLGIINGLKDNARELSFSFKSSQVRKALSKSGQILELTVAVMAAEATDGEGNRVYNDIMTGVVIDWDTPMSENLGIELGNEADVVLMKGVIPVFVSCKNGAVSSDELYKLSVVAEKFGGKFAKKVLVATELDKMGQKKAYIKARASALGIKLIENVDEISADEFRKRIRNMWIS